MPLDRKIGWFLNYLLFFVTLKHILCSWLTWNLQCMWVGFWWPSSFYLSSTRMKCHHAKPTIVNFYLKCLVLTALMDKAIPITEPNLHWSKLYKFWNDLSFVLQQKLKCLVYSVKERPKSDHVVSNSSQRIEEISKGKTVLSIRIFFLVDCTF